MLLAARLVLWALACVGLLSLATPIAGCRGEIVCYKGDAARAQLHFVGQALRAYFQEHGDFPTSAQGLDALVERTTLPPLPSSYPAAGYLKPELVIDPWGVPLRYLRHNENVVVVSVGADGGNPKTDCLCEFVTPPNKPLQRTWQRCARIARGRIA